MALSLAKLGTLVMFPKNSHREDKVSQYCPLAAEGDRGSTNCSPRPENPAGAKGHIPGSKAVECCSPSRPDHTPAQPL